MRSSIKLISLIIFLTAFTVTLCLMSKIAINIFFFQTPPPANNLSVNTDFGYYASVMVTSFLLLIPTLILTRRNFSSKSLHPAIFYIPIFFIATVLVYAFHSFFSGEISWQNVITRIISSLIIFGLFTVLVKSLTAKKTIFLAISSVILLIYVLFAIAFSIFTYIKIGPPWLPNYLEMDSQKMFIINNARDDIQSYVYSFNKLPDNLNQITSTNFVDLNQLNYIRTSDNSYKLCTNFLLDSETLRRFNRISSSEEKMFPHGAGNACFNWEVRIIPPAPPLTCKTLNGQMVTVSPYFGYIGCDMEVTNGDINLSQSYCEGQTTHIREYLIPDSYYRKNRYWTTLQTTNPKEEIKVFATSITGEKVECIPSLNK